MHRWRRKLFPSFSESKIPSGYLWETFYISDGPQATHCNLGAQEGGPTKDDLILIIRPTQSLMDPTNSAETLSHMIKVGNETPQTHDDMIKDASMTAHETVMDSQDSYGRTTARINDETRMLEIVHTPKLGPLTIIMIDTQGIFQREERRILSLTRNPACNKNLSHLRILCAI